MELANFNPENSLESAIAAARQNNFEIERLLFLLADTDLYISSKSEVRQDGTGFEPLLLEQGGHPLVAAFTSPSRPMLHRHVASFFLQMKGREFFARVPKEYGVVINPGYVTQLIITPLSLVDFRKVLSQKVG